MKNNMTIEERTAIFWKCFAPDPKHSGCLVFTGGKSKKGYGVTSFAGRPMRTHRLAWELKCGPIPNGKFVLHRCDNPPCAAIEHLFLGTALDNARDSIKKGRFTLGERNGNAKLTKADVLIIRTSREATTPLARRYGVSREAIRKARNGMFWKHIVSSGAKP